MKLRKTIAGLCLLVLLLGVCACGEESNEIGGVPVTPEMLESVSRSLAQATAVSEPPKNEAFSISSTTAPHSETTLTETTVISVPTDTTVEPAQTTISQPGQTAATSQTAVAVVYWTESGTVYHFSMDCSSLSKSKNILQGSMEEAILAEKERACKRCS